MSGTEKTPAKQRVRERKKEIEKYSITFTANGNRQPAAHCRLPV